RPPGAVRPSPFPACPPRRSAPASSAPASSVPAPSAPVPSVPTPRERKHARDRRGRRGEIVSDRDPLRPRPPEPPHTVPAPAHVHVLFQGSCRGIDDVHAGHPPRRRHHPGLKPPVRQFLGQLVEVQRPCLIPLGSHRNHRSY